jgi:BirA family biotin operon repressor/biotin-[acetyl-CoA-carboxylase] ligase
MDINILEKVDSTNDFAKSELAKGAAHGDAYLAKTQTAGRGQFGRRWDSKAGGMFLSIIYKAGVRDNLTLEIGEIIKKILDKKTGKKFDIKKPNDILYEGRKICGVLCEMKTFKKTMSGVIGIGLNVNNPYLGGDSLCEIMGEGQDILAIAKEILDEVRKLR